MEVCNPPQINGIGKVAQFIQKMEEEKHEHQRLQALDISLKGTPMRWWVMHHTQVGTWLQVTKLLCTRFIVVKYDLSIHFQGMEDAKAHLTLCEPWWTKQQVPSKQWVHIFVHTLDIIPRIWYIQQDTRHETIIWERVSQDFIHTFTFLRDSPVMTTTLGRIRDIILQNEKPWQVQEVVIYTYHRE